jgi:hypothetical protein
MRCRALQEAAEQVHRAQQELSNTDTDSLTALQLTSRQRLAELEAEQQKARQRVAACEDACAVARERLQSAEGARAAVKVRHRTAKDLCSVWSNVCWMTRWAQQCERG